MCSLPLTVRLLGVNHNTAGTELRGRLTVSEADLPGLLAALRSAAGELVVLCTCNRIEVYSASADDPTDAVLAAVSAYTGVPPGDVSAHSYALSGEAAVSHLVSVAAGLDSMVIGEPQVLGQVRRAWELARTHQMTGPTLNTLFRIALEGGKDIRSRTPISRGATSIAHAAVELTRAQYGTLSGRTVLVVGAGETGRLAALNLSSAGVGRLLIANRTYSRAQQLAERLNGQALRLDALPSALPLADVLITCSSSSRPLVSAEMLQRSIGDSRQLLIMDIAVPGNVEAEARQVAGVSLFNMDDIQAVCTRNRHARASAARRAERDVHTWTQKFVRWQREREAVPAVRRLRTDSEAIRMRELARTLNALPELTEAERQAVEVLTRSLTQKLLHLPTVWLRTESTAEQRERLAEMPTRKRRVERSDVDDPA